MSTVKVKNIQHPDASVPAIILASDGTATVAGVGGGGLVAVKGVIKTDTQVEAGVTSGDSFGIDGLSIAHTLADASNRLIISAYIGVGMTNDSGFAGLAMSIADDGTLILLGDSPNSIQTRVGSGGYNNDGGVFNVTFVYEPGDTAEHTYQVHAINAAAGTITVYINRSVNDGPMATLQRGTSALTIMEVSV
jgi:hypothetical protein